MIPFSVLDLSLITRGSTPAEAFRNTLDFSRLAETLGFRRYWLAEHHAMPGIASAATAVLIGQVAGATQRIRVGAGGIMLPNHSPLVVAEQFGTLETLFPGRIDLGLGRAPGADQRTARALRRDPLAPDRFPDDVVELLHYFEPASEEDTHLVRAIPGAGLRVPVWILGSSLFSAVLAAQLGLPYAFASHFAPGQMDEAITLYRARFEPSVRCPKPHVMLTANVIAADDDAGAGYLATSLQQYFIALRRGRPTAFPPPVDASAGLWSEQEQAMLDHTLSCTFAGSVPTIAPRLEAFIARYRPDELMVAVPVYDHEKRRHALELTAEMAGR
ncbi:LLM class flavin-dependent oxidoreductase [Acetobacter oeni]|uniref:Luciferase-like monooxygenase n=1 Tax=Acetobacter oeni TaxID=304077 RepID=A0A511XJA9_9PROT|nr:LLM class flavin-dependent oxidoreductase [Acetobacter oeni]MBB3882776.1 luciferase family oxidoreductase group 1 [Acetobacter oeni]NHO18868.1 MsnO8 family LLM class oxidoreductase [Acetobacter oeni]GBR06403.1 luciferase-like monooxygenase [Acetobacter oeni LMG 21952]GEN63037.1 alkane 1-monooxygenase [Acetobacter oeni]